MTIRFLFMFLLTAVSTMAGGLTDFDIIVNEINYHPLAGEEGAEFVELYNRGTDRVDLSAWRLEAEGARSGFSFTIPSGTSLEPGRFLVLCRRSSAMEEVYGLEREKFLEWGEGDLPDDGGRISLFRRDGFLIASVRYDDDDFRDGVFDGAQAESGEGTEIFTGSVWPASADGLGSTLERTDPKSFLDFPRTWHASSLLRGTPGAPNGSAPPREPVLRINETGRSGGSFWVELFSTDASPVNVEGYVLVGGPGLSRRLELPAGVADPFLVVDLPFDPGASTPFVLLAPDGKTLLDSLPAPHSVSAWSDGSAWRRFPDGAADLFFGSRATPGERNLKPALPQVLISEIMYQPPLTGEPPRENLEYVEIVNAGAEALDLSDWFLVSNGKLLYLFPASEALEAGGVLVVGRDPAALEAAHGLPGGSVLGPFRVNLSDAGGIVELRDATGNLLDRVVYSNRSPWPPEAAGGGASLSLTSTAYGERGNDAASAWKASPGGDPGVAPGGEPVPPLVFAVSHDPPVPRSDETVRVVCRPWSQETLSSVELRYRVGGGALVTRTMRDDGTAGDEIAGDGLWTARVGPFPNGSVVAFHILAEDGLGRRTDSPGSGRDFLFAVDNGHAPSNRSLSYRVVVTDATWQALKDRSVWSDELLDATIIDSEGGIHYNAGLRYRGRRREVRESESYRIEFPFPFGPDCLRALDLNHLHADRQFVAADFFREAGVPGPQAWTANVWIHGEWDDSYTAFETVGEEFLDRRFGPGGEAEKLYRGVRDGNRSGDFTFYGTDPADYEKVYEKVSGSNASDSYEEIIRLCAVFSSGETSDDEFPEKLAAVADIDEWILFFAAQACAGNTVPGLALDSGEDYFLFFRPDDGRAVLLPGEFDGMLGSTAQHLFRPSSESVRRLLYHPLFAPCYYAFLEKLIDGPFSRLGMRRRIRLLEGIYSFGTRDHSETYVANRLGFLARNAPRRISGGVEDVSAPKLIAEGARCRYFKGTRDPSGGSTAWTETDFDDSSWPEGPSGFGYGDGDDATVLGDMENGYSTVFIRRRFTIDDLGLVTALTLRIDYDDGFVAYLNGTRVASGNVPAGAPSFDWTANGSHEAGSAEEFDLTDRIGLLKEGVNVLAVVGVNRALDSSDFSLIPELVLGGSGSGGGCGEFAFVANPAVTLRGKAPAADTRRVEVGGKEAFFDYVSAQWEAQVPLSTGENLITVRALGDDDRLLEEKVFHVRRVSGFTPLSGSLTSNLTLRAEDSPYLLTGRFEVPSGRKLSIEPGVAVVAAGDSSIVVEGLIEAEGTEAAPIIFVSADCSNPWRGIGIRDTGTGENDPLNRLSHCIFLSGEKRSDFTGFVSPDHSKLLVENCRFADLNANGVDGSSAELTVRGCLFERTYEAVHCNSSTVTIEDTTFRGIIGDKDAIDFDGDGARPSRIEGCTIDGSMDDGIDLASTTCFVRNNFIRGCGDKALSFEGDGRRGHPIISGNVIIRSGTAVALKNGVVVEDGSHNTIVGNQEGIRVYAKTSGSPGSRGAFQYCIVWHNGVDVDVDSASRGEVTFSDVGDRLWPGEGNICEDPLFVSEYEDSFHLTPDSPCLLPGGEYMGALPACESGFVRGDANSDGTVDLSDAIYTLGYLFASQGDPECVSAMDANDNGAVSIADPIYLLGYLYRGGPKPPPPFPDPGPDPTPDDLPCRRVVDCP